MPLPEPGELFEREYTVSGARIGLLAEVEVVGSQLHLKDVAIYPKDAAQATPGAPALLGVLRDELMTELGEEGFSSLRISGQRLSGARPGRIVDVTLKLQGTEQ